MDSREQGEFCCDEKRELFSGFKRLIHLGVGQSCILEVTIYGLCLIPKDSHDVTKDRSYTEFDTTSIKSILLLCYAHYFYGMEFNNGACGMWMCFEHYLLV
jgi:hypothetical protein